MKFAQAEFVFPPGVRKFGDLSTPLVDRSAFLLLHPLVERLHYRIGSLDLHTSPTAPRTTRGSVGARRAIFRRGPILIVVAGLRSPRQALARRTLQRRALLENAKRLRAELRCDAGLL